MKRLLPLLTVLLLLCGSAHAAKIRVVLAGDSTVTDGSGWGRGFKHALGADAECVNLAQNGRSSKSFRTEGWWAKCLAEKPDYLLIQFGHNDQPGKGPERETDPATTFPANLKQFIAEARAAGIRPILVTSIGRRTWDGHGKINSSLTPYAEAVKKVGREEKVPVLDMHTRTIELYERLGREKCNELSPLSKGKIDGTHLNSKGSEVIGKLVAEELGAYLKK
jgi:lysophospholipase L1-like esterase